jgi:hypothetical protein
MAKPLYYRRLYVIIRVRLMTENKAQDDTASAVTYFSVVGQNLLIK